ncbi:MAG TPA: hypothetical protein VLG47_01460 [Candidatus Saccharimonadales bacterium]|nr:hypothetical protein [Candidatus Saccharimonadales bacterium]
MVNMQRKIPAMPFIFSALGTAFGFFIMFFGATLHDGRDYVDTYSNAVHIPATAGLVILIGGIIATLGLIGMIRALFFRR